MNDMRWESFFQSATLAWQRRSFRYFCLSVAGVIIFFSGWYLWSILPLRHQPDIVFHYTIYLGIDDTRAWPWLFFPVGGWWLIVAVDFLLAFLYYRSDPLAAWTLVTLSLIASVPWAFSLYSLLRVNV